MELTPVRRITEEPTWFGPQDRPLAGWVTYPADRRVRGGVVLCLPTGEETRLARRTFRDLARTLASAGWASLRFDYDGTGDSAGELNDERRASWTQSFLEAHRYVAALGVRQVSAVGMRLGATIAAAGAAEHELPLATLVLWDPCDSGRSFLREQTLLGHSMRSDEPTEQAAARPEQPPGFVETPGYVIGPTAAAHLREVALPTAPGSLTGAVVALVRDDRPTAPRTAAWLASAGASVEPVSGQAELLNRTIFTSAVPVEALARVTEVVVGASDRPHLLTPPATRREAHFRHHGRTITETFHRIGEHGLFAISSEPSCEATGPTAVFLNTATETHVGPARMWVTLGREWAAGGVRTLRVDLSGVGETDPWPGRDRDVVLAPEWIDDTGAIVEACGPTVLVGLSSGGYSALEGALQFDVAGVIAINPGIQIDWFVPPHDPRRRGLRRLPRCLRPIRNRKVSKALWVAAQQVLVRQAPTAVFAGAVRRGADVCVILSDWDWRFFSRTLYWRTVGAWRLRATGRFALAPVGDADHAALFADGRARIMSAATAHIDRMYGGLRSTHVHDHDGAQQLAGAVSL